jgi:protein-L-isoaspartate(D-aspartate) O-methyltransferase
MSDYDQILRSRMVASQLVAQGITDPRVLDSMRQIPRHRFVPKQYRAFAYHERSLPIGEGQKLFAPFTIALMLQALKLQGHERVLEIGTCSGYQTALLCHLAAEVFSVECRPRLAGRAGQALDTFDFDNLEIYVGDGSQGLPDMAHFDAILVNAAAPTHLPQLSAQLSTQGGRLVLPVGTLEEQRLQVITRQDDCWQVEEIEATLCLPPLVGRHGFYSLTQSND